MTHRYTQEELASISPPSRFYLAVSCPNCGHAMKALTLGCITDTAAPCIPSREGFLPIVNLAHFENTVWHCLHCGRRTDIPAFLKLEVNPSAKSKTPCP